MNEFFYLSIFCGLRLIYFERWIANFDEQPDGLGWLSSLGAWPIRCWIAGWRAWYPSLREELPDCWTPGWLARSIEACDDGTRSLCGSVECKCFRVCIHHFQAYLNNAGNHQVEVQWLDSSEWQPKRLLNSWICRPTECSQCGIRNCSYPDDLNTLGCIHHCWHRIRPRPDIVGYPCKKI